MELQSTLLSYERRLEQINGGLSSKSIGQASANFATNKNIYQNKGHNQTSHQSNNNSQNSNRSSGGNNYIERGGRFGGRSGRSGGNTRPICQVCGKVGHTAAYYYFRQSSSEVREVIQQAENGALSTPISPKTVHQGEGNSTINSPQRSPQSDSDSVTLNSIPVDSVNIDSSIQYSDSIQHIPIEATQILGTERETEAGHWMQTRAKSGIHKPKRFPAEYKLYTATTSNIPAEPRTT
ncbi:hypothetical protein LWI28_011021 [Acer negundo]|uniref:Uncharacterized protein n=1 Tax=Acer negundo TaxID=4023 RepID=A0AAD5NR80_ACENE|nr:hypothetical protein LWI28_011021 [Acer negundo]